jgi:hypothetical protein
VQGNTTWWSWKVYVPAGFHVDTDVQSPDGNGWFIHSQWHGTGGGPGPNISFHFTKGPAPQFFVDTSGGSTGSPAYTSGEWVQSTPFPLGSWVSMVVGVTFGDTAAVGRITVSINGSTFLNNQACSNLYTCHGCYFKQGIYRSRSSNGNNLPNGDQFIYITGTKRGLTEASVA